MSCGFCRPSLGCARGAGANARKDAARRDRTNGQARALGRLFLEQRGEEIATLDEMGGLFPLPGIALLPPGANSASAEQCIAFGCQERATSTPFNAPALYDGLPMLG